MKNPNVHKLVKVERVIDETPTVRTLVVSDEILHDARPGQFCMVWIPGVAEFMHFDILTVWHRIWAVGKFYVHD